MKLDAYRRGNRDGLLSFAARLEAKAAALDAEYDDLKGRPGWRPRHESQFAYLLHIAQELSVQAASARLAAEALPYDPEAP